MEVYVLIVQRKKFSEKLIKHTEQGTFTGNAFDVGTSKLYEQLYYKITENREMDVNSEMAMKIIELWLHHGASLNQCQRCPASARYVPGFPCGRHYEQ